MIVEDAIALMKTSKSVEDWNEKRDFAKATSTKKEWNKIYPQIDTWGLIVKVLKPKNYANTRV